MATQTKTVSWQRAFFFYATLCLVIASLYFARVVILPVVLSILFAFVLAPLVSWLQRQGLHRIIAVSLVVGFATLIFAGVIGTVIYQANELATEIPEYKDNIFTKVTALQESSQGTPFQRLFDMWTDWKKANEEAQNIDKTKPVPVTIEQSSLPMLTSVASYTADFLINVGMVLLLVFFILLSREDMRNRVIGVCGNCNLTSTTKAIDDASQRVSRFLGMQLIVNGTYGAALGIGLFFMGIPFSFIWGFLAALLRYIPYLGPWVAAAFPLIIAFAVFPDWGPMVGVVIYFLILELISNNFMEPWLYGRSIGVSEAALIFSVAFWAWLWGPLGLILATPITACLVVFGRHFTSLSLVPHFLGNEPVLSTEITFYQRLLAKDVDEANDLVEAFIQEHPVETVYDEVLLPALLQTKKYQDSGDLTRDDRKYIYTGLRQIVDEIVEPAMDESHEKNQENRPVVRLSRRVRTLGLAWDPAGETGLYLLKSMCDLTLTDWRIFPLQGGWGEAVDQIRREKPQILILGTLQTRRLGRIRAFCRRIKSHFPDLVILVHAWGQEDAQSLRTQVQAVGADDVATSFVEGWSQFKTHMDSVIKAEPESATQTNGSNGARKSAVSKRH